MECKIYIAKVSCKFILISRPWSQVSIFFIIFIGLSLLVICTAVSYLYMWCFCICQYTSMWLISSVKMLMKQVNFFYFPFWTFDNGKNCLIHDVLTLHYLLACGFGNILEYFVLWVEKNTNFYRYETTSLSYSKVIEHIQASKKS